MGVVEMIQMMRMVVKVRVHKWDNCLADPRLLFWSIQLMKSDISSEAWESLSGILFIQLNQKGFWILTFFTLCFGQEQE